MSKDVSKKRHRDPALVDDEQEQAAPPHHHHHHPQAAPPEEEGGSSLTTATRLVARVLRGAFSTTAAVSTPLGNEEVDSDEEGKEHHLHSAHSSFASQQTAGGAEEWTSSNKNNKSNNQSSSACSSGSSDGSSDTDEASERGMREDRVKHYPRFTDEYVSKCKYDLVPFIRHLTAEERAVLTPAAEATTPSKGGGGCRDDGGGFALYEQYRYVRTLGKGTYSKVVLAEQIIRPLAPPKLPSPEQAGVGISFYCPPPLVALKVFRNQDAYREACWEEATIVGALCTHTNDPNNPVTGASQNCSAGLMDYYSSTGRFMAPLAYIPHPLHPAIVYPVMGPSLLHVTRLVKRSSRAFLDERRRLRASQSPSRQDEEADFGSARREKDASTSKEHRIWLRGLPFPLVRLVVYQILLFLRYIHARGAVHTDLKPENVLFEGTTRLPSEVGIHYVCRNNSNNSNNNNSSSSGRARSLAERKEANDSHKLNSATKENGGIVFPNTPPSPPGAAGSSSAAFSPAPPDHSVRVMMPLLSSIRVVDLGAARFTSSFNHCSPLDSRVTISYDPIQTSHYRSPEVLLGLGWSTPADIFSLGCMIPELVTGDCVFMPQDTLEHLALMEHIIGPFNGSTRNIIKSYFATNARTYEYYFTPHNGGGLKWPMTTALLREHEASQQSHVMKDDDEDSLFDKMKLTSLDDIAFVRDRPTLQEVLGHQPLLLDLVERMLAYDPMDRITAEEALQHPFFSATI